MTADLVLAVPATMTGLRGCLDRIMESGIRSSLSRDTISRLQLIVEELLTNTIKYGYGGECERLVRIRVRCTSPVELVYEDEAPAFDPTAWREPGSDGESTDETGGRVGITLVLGMATRVTYERLPSGNRLTLHLV